MVDRRSAQLTLPQKLAPGQAGRRTDVDVVVIGSGIAGPTTALVRSLDIALDLRPGMERAR